MSRQTRRPTVGDGSAEVVSIGIGGTHRPDYSKLACGDVAAARQKLGMDHRAFSRHINEMTDRDEMPETLAAWEDDVLPPGDVVKACSAITQGAPIIASPLLAAVHSAFAAEELEGPWVTTYEFAHAGKPHYHADIARIVAEAGNRVRAVNYPPEPRSQGRRKPFRNEIAAQLVGRHLVGEWQNTSDLRYCGALQLAVLPGEMVMQGHYTGIGSDIEVSDGKWKWVRLEPGADLAGITLREPAALHDLVMNHPQIDVPLTLADIREDHR